MKTLSDVSRKAHSNVLSLASEPGAGSRFCRRTATSGRQDFRQLHSSRSIRGIRLARKRSQASRVGRTGCKERATWNSKRFSVPYAAGETLTNLTRAFCQIVP